MAEQKVFLYGKKNPMLKVLLLWFYISFCTEEHIVAKDIEARVQILNYSLELHECFKGSDQASS